MRGEAEGANHNDAAWLLDFYSTFAEDIDADASDHALSALSQVEGRFGVRTGLQLQLFEWTETSNVAGLHSVIRVLPSASMFSVPGPTEWQSAADWVVVARASLDHAPAFNASALRLDNSKQPPCAASSQFSSCCG